MTPTSEAQRSVGTQRLATRDAKQLKAFGPSGLWAGFGGRVNRSQSVSPALLAPPQHGGARKRCCRKVPVTISNSYVSLGWWMVMSEDEQGYAPAAYLEPMEGASKHNEQMMDSSEACEGE